MDLRDIIERAGKTAVQAFGAQVAASGLGILDFVQDAALVDKAGLAVLGAVVSVVWNAALNWSAR